MSDGAPSPMEESDLARALEEEAFCELVLLLEENLFEITFRAPRLAERARPGEFAQIWVSSSPMPLLRRPFSFSRVDPGPGTVSFYLGAVGEGSRRLRDFQTGTRARILGPLGRGFTLPQGAGRSLVVSGGLGAAPFPFLVERLIEQGQQVIWLNGARSRPELYPSPLIPDGVQEQLVYTDDGSAGRRGLVTEELPERLSGAAALYACGPNSMLAEVAAICRRHRQGAPLLAEVSIEAPMGCGFGTCLGCAFPVISGHPDVAQLALCCRQGPVLDPDLVDWPRLLAQPAHLS